VGTGASSKLRGFCARGLAAKGHKVSLVCPDGSQCDQGVEIIPCGPAGMIPEDRAYGGFGEIKDGERVVRPAHPGYWQHLLNADCIIDHSWLKSSYLLKMEGRLPNTPILGVLHAPVHTMIHSLPPGVEKPCFVCISKDQASHFEALFSPAQARVCYNGVDVDGHYKPLNVPRSGRYLFLARFSSIKGPREAALACRETRQELDLVGDTQITGEPQYFEECKRLCDGKQVKMIGPASRGECVWWFSQAKALLHPNRIFREPFGLAPVEAQACGCPIVTFDYGAMRETVLHGETGFVVKTFAEFTEIVRSGAVDSINRDRCREWASQFSIQNMTDRYAELCEEAVATGGW
jgi:glycosyltransferase involved in cell wall biosynthesis